MEAFLHPQSTGSQSHHSTILLHPHLLPFLDTQDLVHLSELSKEYSSIIKSDATIGYWHAMCTSLADQGVYCPPLTKKFTKDYFFSELWKARTKWNTVSDVQDFKIKVSARFKPGQYGQSKFALPLHQFLKVRSQQLKHEKREGAVFVGENTPEHMLDSLLGTIMNDPVMLRDSRKVLDRSVAVACVLRGGMDPFSGSKLTSDCLIPMPELKQEINDFKKRQANVDITVHAADAKLLVEEVDPLLLEALVAVEQLNFASRRAQIDSIESNRVGSNAHPADRINQHAPHAPETETGVVAEGAAEHMNGLMNAYIAHQDTNGNNDHSEGSATDVSSRDIGETSDGFVSRWSKVKSDSAHIVDVNGSNACVTMHVPGTGVRPFYFNKVFPDKDRQLSIYDQYARDIVVSALNGQNGCVLCYGQTGSGKTFTMFGPPGQEDGGASLFEDMQVTDSEGLSGAQLELKILQKISTSNDSIGIVLRSCAEILRGKKLFEKRGDVSLQISAQYVEIYSEIVTDLMSGRRVQVRRGNGELSGATEIPINSLSDVVEVLREGNMRKHFAATAMNDRSSRSHTVLVFQLVQSSIKNATQLKSVLYLVDLAGSERVKKSKAVGLQMREATSINSSLLVLGKVIERLSRSDFHVPYFESQLTTVLKGAFGGNSRTGVIVTCRSDDKLHGDETLQSLRFGELCGMISNSTRLAASSVDKVLDTLNQSIEQVSHQMTSMERTGKQHLASFQSLKLKLNDLKAKRDGVALILERSSAKVVR